jgi:hypothetical protein
MSVENLRIFRELPLPQDSYANAIYSNACQRRSMRKQGSYETAVESGAAVR